MPCFNGEETIFNDVNDGFLVKVASPLEEATRILEVGFGCVTDMDGKTLFKKRKRMKAAAIFEKEWLLLNMRALSLIQV